MNNYVKIGRGKNITRGLLLLASHEYIQKPKKNNELKNQTLTSLIYTSCADMQTEAFKVFQNRFYWKHLF